MQQPTHQPVACPMPDCTNVIITKVETMREELEAAGWGPLTDMPAPGLMVCSRCRNL